MEARNVIDTHVHFWELHEFRYSFGEFPTSDIPELYRNVSIETYKDDVKKINNINIVGIVYVQVYHTEKETEKIIQLSKENSLLRGIVGWTDLMNPDVDANLKRLISISNGKLIGIRHLLQYEDFSWIWKDEVQRGLKCLEENNMCYDLSFKPPDLKHVPELAVKFPKMNFIIDHMAKPQSIVDYMSDPWFEDMKKASEFPNIFCKLSGLVSEVCNSWSIELFEPYVKHILDCFGYERCMYGADWPVFNLAKGCGVDNVFEIIDVIVNKHFNGNKDIWNDIFHNNAIKIYKLN